MILIEICPAFRAGAPWSGEGYSVESGTVRVRAPGGVQGSRLWEGKGVLIMCMDVALKVGRWCVVVVRVNGDSGGTALKVGRIGGGVVVVIVAGGGLRCP